MVWFVLLKIDKVQIIFGINIILTRKSKKGGNFVQYFKT